MIVDIIMMKTMNEKDFIFMMLFPKHFLDKHLKFRLNSKKVCKIVRHTHIPRVTDL